MSASITVKSPDSYWNGLTCSTNRVPEDSGRKLHRAKDIRQSGQAFARSWSQEPCKSNSKMGLFDP